LLLLLLVGASVAYVWWRRDVDELRLRRSRLRARFEELISARDRGLLASAPNSDVALGVPHAYAQGLVEDVAQHLLSRVTLDLSDLRVTKRGEVEKKVLVRTFLLGRWRMDAHVHRLRGILKAGHPHLGAVDDERISLAMPVSVEAGALESSLRFAWDSRGVATAVCRDFTVRQRARASIVPETYQLSGELRLVADGALVGVRSRLVQRKLRVRLRPTPQTWARTRRALERQDSFWRCGVALKPEGVLEQLRELVANGFDVMLPEDLIPPLRLPASFRSGVDQEDVPLRLAVHVDTLRVTQRALWYGASVKVNPISAPRARLASPR